MLSRREKSLSNFHSDNIMRCAALSDSGLGLESHSLISSGVKKLQLGEEFNIITKKERKKERKKMSVCGFAKKGKSLSLRGEAKSRHVGLILLSSANNGLRTLGWISFHVRTSAILYLYSLIPLAMLLLHFAALYFCIQHIYYLYFCIGTCNSRQIYIYIDCYIFALCGSLAVNEFL